MLFNTLSLAALSATLATAAQAPVQVKKYSPAFGEQFGIEATAKELGTAAVQLTASSGRIYIGGKQDQPTDCSSAQTVHDYATFVWQSDKTIFLYSNNPAKPQQLWSYGDGLTGYNTAKQTLPSPDSTSPYEIATDTRVVTFKGVTAKACPEGSDKPNVWGIWFSKAEKPGNLAGCFPVELKAYKTTGRDACTYSYLKSCDEAPEQCRSKATPVGV